MADASTRPPWLTGSDNELFAILDAAWVDGDELEHLSRADLLAWRDAAAARVLAEAGAVHPQVHTPNRVMEWLAGRDWRHEPSPDPRRWAVEWANGRAQQTVYVPQHADTDDYTVRVYDLLCIAAVAADLTLSQVLAEVAALPDTWTW